MEPNSPKKNFTLIKLFAPLAVGLFVAKIATSFVEAKERQAWLESLTPSVRSAVELCQEDPFYAPVEEDGLDAISFAGKTGLAQRIPLTPFTFVVSDNILDELNPPLEKRPDKRLNLGETIALPPTDDVRNYLLERNPFVEQLLYPYPGAPKEGILNWLEQNDPETFTALDARADAVANFLRNGRQVKDEYHPPDIGVLKDTCIFDIHGHQKIISDNSVRYALAVYAVNYLHDDFIQEQSRRVPIYVQQLNKIIKQSDLDHGLSSDEEIPPNLINYAIFRSPKNEVGGGIDGPNPFFIVNVQTRYDVDGSGRPYTLDPMLQEQGIDTGNTFIRDVIRLGIQNFAFRGENSQITLAQSNFAHSAFGLLTMFFEDQTENGFSMHRGLDPRIQYLYQVLLQSGLSREGTYLDLLRASLRFTNIEDIEYRFNTARAPDDPSFSELFAHRDTFSDTGKSAYKDYYLSSQDPAGKYTEDYQGLLDTIRLILLMDS